MKRFHVHVAVDNLTDNIRFYSTLFGSEPTVAKDDYAKWMLDDPRINFAISSRGGAAGIDHLGLQVDSDAELHAMRDQLSAADAGMVTETGANCCYARSDKYWTTDPQGIAWETWHTLASIPVFGGCDEAVRAAFADPASVTEKSDCCAPRYAAQAESSRPETVETQARASCCK